MPSNVPFNNNNNLFLETSFVQLLFDETRQDKGSPMDIRGVVTHLHSIDLCVSECLLGLR